MTRKAEFNAEDWSLVLEAPLLAALAVVSAARGGTIRETLSIGKAYAEERQNHGNSELLDAIVSEQPTRKPSGYPDPQALRADGMARLRDAVAVIERTGTTVELEDYRRFSYGMADRVARSHKEGGFLGIGGTEVSEEEREALDEIAAALGHDPEVGEA